MTTKSEQRIARFQYDAVGNRLVKNADTARTTSTYDVANQLSTSEDVTGTTNYTFDANGNQQIVVEPSGNRTTTTWDYENQPTKVELPSGTVNTSTYNAENLRTEILDSTGTKRFVWDGQQYLLETDETNTTQSVWTNEPDMFTNLVSQRRGGATQYPHFDALGSTRELTDSAETSTDTWIYDAWGNIINRTGTTDLPFQFVGMHGYFTDSGTGTNYIIRRVYQPAIARWWGVDPLRFIDGTDRYLYSANIPTVLIDPNGLCAVCQIEMIKQGVSMANRDMAYSIPYRPNRLAGIALARGVSKITTFLGGGVKNDFKQINTGAAFPPSPGFPKYGLYDASNKNRDRHLVSFAFGYSFDYCDEGLSYCRYTLAESGHVEVSVNGKPWRQAVPTDFPVLFNKNQLKFKKVIRLGSNGPTTGYAADFPDNTNNLATDLYGPLKIPTTCKGLRGLSCRDGDICPRRGIVTDAPTSASFGKLTQRQGPFNIITISRQVISQELRIYGPNNKLVIGMNYSLIVGRDNKKPYSAKLFAEKRTIIANF